MKIAHSGVMKSRTKRTLRKPVMIGLSLGILGVFYFYIDRDPTETKEAKDTDSCIEQMAGCELSEDARSDSQRADAKEENSPANESSKTDKEEISPKLVENSSEAKVNNTTPKRKRAKGYQFKLIDTKGDGKADSVDVDLDGEADYVLGDVNGDGVADFADLDGDTVSDVIFYDDNNDGIIDTFDIDMNQRPNGIFVDRDGDGFSESAVLQAKTEICYAQQSGLRQTRTLIVRTAAISDFLARGARIGSCEALVAKQESD